ncbi:hypothetical protein SAMN05421747_116107 [Parapedobacter composti]|uniref:Uncharacterized protein n=1 Tax=Parapedobacter composti TaxID=623281 RepID=A0A1I1KNG2_9SPHI|nr:hypothetical protein SAMN05421747_116107 [Parapedobacter composti]
MFLVFSINNKILNISFISTLRLWFVFDHVDDGTGEDETPRKNKDGHR